MKGPIRDGSATAFAWSFYQALGFNSSVKQAYDLARNQIDVRGLRDRDVPKLIARTDVEPEDVRLLGDDVPTGDRMSGEQPSTTQSSISYAVNVSDGIQGAVAVGPGAIATGTVSLGGSGTTRRRQGV